MVRSRPRLALGLLLAFTGFLRVGELLSLPLSCIRIVNMSLAIISLPLSKGALIKGRPETVLVRDASIISALAFLKERSLPQEKLLSCSYRQFAATVVESAAFYGLQHPCVTSHGLRRGGATWHFGVHKSYDLTQQHGRWSDARTAQIYIDQAMMEDVMGLLTVANRQLLLQATRVLHSLLRRHFA